MKNKRLYILDSDDQYYRSDARSVFFVIINTLKANFRPGIWSYMRRNNNIRVIYPNKRFVTRDFIYVNGKTLL